MSGKSKTRTSAASPKQGAKERAAQRKAERERQKEREVDRRARARSARSGVVRDKKTRSGTTRSKSTHPAQPDIELAQLGESADRIAIMVKDASPGACVSPKEAGFDETPLPLVTLMALSKVMRAFADGGQPKLLVLDDDGEMTTAQAAEVLGVSRPHLVHLLDAHEVPFRRVGDSETAHRRIRSSDVLALKEQRERGHRSMDELMTLSKDLAD